MSLNLSSFERADYVVPEPPPAPVAPAFETNTFAAALALGFAGAIVGAIVYAAFITISGIEIGYLAIGIAWLVARAMIAGSRGRGGREFQIAAVVLTLLSVGIGNALMLWWTLHKEQPVPLSAHNIFLLLGYGLRFPFLEMKESGVSGLIGLFILFIGLRAAWRMTSGLPGAAEHPFRR